MATVLLLGAGRVSRPIVRYFLDETDADVVVASLYVEDAEQLIDGHPRGRASALDAGDDASLAPLIRAADVAVSLVPYALHPRIARLAIEHRVPMVTASYVSPEMQALDAEARARGVLLLNEMGFDPGLDHMSAAHLIRRARDRGARITRFVSCAGGLPHPDCADNPWKYRFSWSPRGVLLAGLADARYLADGHVVERPSPGPFAHPFPYPIEGLGELEMYPNRDSVKYRGVYGLTEVRDMLRGTLRYPGWCETMKATVELGLLDDTPRDWDGRATFADWARTCAGRPAERGARGARDAAAAKLGLSADAAPLERLDWAGLFDEEPVPEGRASALDRIADRMGARMDYGPDQRDRVILHHEVVAETADGARRRHVSLLVSDGEAGGDTAMARTVSLPAAVAADLILEGRFSAVGVEVPTAPEIGEPVLEQLELKGLRFREIDEAT